MAAGRTPAPIVVKGIRPGDTDHPQPFAYGNRWGGASFSPATVTGPGDVAKRDVRVHLNGPEVALVLGNAVRAVDAANDPDLEAAYLKVAAYLNARQEG